VIELADIEAARERIAGSVTRTPLVRLHAEGAPVGRPGHDSGPSWWPGHDSGPSWWSRQQRFPDPAKRPALLPGLALVVRQRQQFLGVRVAEFGVLQAGQHPGQLPHPGLLAQLHHAAGGDQPVA
jgi:hypothetical protein